MKLYFLSQHETSLAESDASVVDAVRLELLERHEIVEASSADNADALILHEPWAFSEWRYIDRRVPT